MLCWLHGQWLIKRGYWHRYVELTAPTGDWCRRWIVTSLILSWRHDLTASTATAAAAAAAAAAAVCTCNMLQQSTTSPLRHCNRQQQRIITRSDQLRARPWRYLRGDICVWRIFASWRLWCLTSRLCTAIWIVMSSTIPRTTAGKRTSPLVMVRCPMQVVIRVPCARECTVPVFKRCYSSGLHFDSFEHQTICWIHRY